MKILVINSGSSSIKYQLFSMPDEKVLASGKIEKIGEAGSRIKSHHQGLKLILSKIKHDISAIGHRVVHGAEFFTRPTLINKEVISKLRVCSKLAPLHNPPNLEGILACKELLPRIKQVAVFDTAFYQTLSKEVFIYGLPYKYYSKYGIRRYGFHGTSHEYVAHKVAQALKKPLRKLNLITCHLGNGCSITAIRNGKAVETSMGFTPLEGLLMGTRCGDIDPAIVIYIIGKENLSHNEMDKVLNKKSGLLGISGVSNDYRKLEIAASKGNKRAKLAIEIFIHRLRKYIGAYIAVLGRVDAIVFTAGIGENAREVRKKATAGIVDNLKNKPRVLVIHTDEELMIANQAFKLARA